MEGARGEKKKAPAINRMPTRAQTVSELAVFGAILIFVIGAMIRYAVNFNYNQNQQLAAMRMALKLSYQAGVADNTARKSATVIYIEDRQDVSPGKYASQNRTPYIVTGSGAFTNDLMLPTDWMKDSVPMMDIFVNGEPFTFSTARYKVVTVARVTNTENNYGYDCSPGRRDDEVHPCTPAFPDECPDGIDYRRVWSTENNWTVQPAPCFASGGSGCGVFLARLANLPLSRDKRFCLVRERCPVHFPWDMPLQDRFNLDLSSTFYTGGRGQKCTGNTGNPDYCDVIGSDLAMTAFPWQWDYVKGTTSVVNFGEGGVTGLDVDLDGKEEQVMGYTDHLDRTVWADGSSSSPDEEECPLSSTDAIIVKFYVMDSQDGDWDGTFGDWDKRFHPDRVAPGLASEQAMVTQTNVEGRRGTFLRITEANRQSRSEQKSDRLDIIERKIQLSNDTGRLCRKNYGPDVVCCCDPAQDPFCPPDPGASVTIPVGGRRRAVYWNCGPEACLSQGAGAPIPDLIYRHCFDQKTKVLHIRSRIGERRGTRWITDTSPRN